LTSDPDRPPTHSASAADLIEGKGLSGGPHERRRKRVQRITRDWFRRWLEVAHECERCGDLDDARVHAPLRNGEVVCWYCAERAGEFQTASGWRRHYSGIG
jgi:hypothetical protein